MALTFRRLSAPQASRHRVVNSTDLTSSQSSHERRDAVGQCGHDAGRHSHLQLDTISASKGILFYTPDLRAELRQTSLSCVFCRNMNSNVSVKLNLYPGIEDQVAKDQQEALQNYQSLSRSHFNTFLSESQSTVPRFRKRCENSQPGCSPSYLVLTT